MTDIFLSYKREDREKVRPLVEALQAQGWPVWWDTRIGVSETWDAVIEAQIKSAKCVLVVWSPLSIESRWVRSEAHEGLERNCLVPVTIGNTRPPLAFRLIQSSDLSGWKGDRHDAAFVQVCEAIARLVGRQATPPPLPPRPPPRIWQAIAAFVVERKKTIAAAGLAALAAAIGAVAYLPRAGVPAASVEPPAPKVSPPPIKLDIASIEQAPVSPLAGTDCQTPLPSATVILACSQAILKSPTLAEAYSIRGDAYRRQGKYSLAQADLDKALTLKPQDVLSRARRGYLHEMTRSRQLTRADYDAVLAATPRSAEDYLARCETHLGRLSYDQANEACSQAIKRDPRLAQAYASRSSARESMQDYEGAVADATAAIGMVGRYATAFMERGRTYHAMTDFQRAFADYNKAIELDPQLLWAYIARGTAHRVAKSFEFAIADFNRAIDLDGRLSEGYSGRAEVFYEMKDYMRAIADQTQAIKFDEQNALAFNGRGNVYFATKDYERAIVDYTAAINIDNSLTWAYNNRAYAYRLRGQSGDRDRAIADFRRALTIEPNFENSVRGLREMGVKP